MDKKIIDKIIRESSYFVRNGEAIKAIKRYTERGGRILEIGPGAGGLLKLLEASGYKVEAVDNKNRINAVIFEKIKILDVCFSPLPFPNNYFDAVVMFETMEHLENPYFVVREIERILKNGGVFIFGIPYIHNLKSKLSFFLKGEIMDYTAKNDHRTLFTKAVFGKTFKNFIVSEIIFGGGFVKIFGRKVKFNSQALHKLFGQRVLYILKKK